MPCVVCNRLITLYDAPVVVEFKHQYGYEEWVICGECRDSGCDLVNDLASSGRIWNIRTR